MLLVRLMHHFSFTNTSNNLIFLVDSHPLLYLEHLFYYSTLITPQLLQKVKSPLTIAESKSMMESTSLQQGLSLISTKFLFLVLSFLLMGSGP